MADGLEPAVGRACGAIGTGEHVFGKLRRRSDGRRMVQAVLQPPLEATSRLWSNCGCSASAGPCGAPSTRRAPNRLGWSDHQPRQRGGRWAA
jgi:hypothetical protein